MRRLLLLSCLTLVLGAPSSLLAQKRKAEPKPAPIRLPSAVIKAPTGSIMDVAPLSRSSSKDLAAAAAKIDDLLAGDLLKHNLKPSQPLREDQFLRRIYLDLGGRIPTVPEAIEYLDSESKDKRSELIDKLLESPDYVSHFYNFWADILRLTERPQNNIIFDPYLAYVKDTIRQNTPYDQWVYEMLTAEGKLWENPAVGFQIRDDGMPLPYIDNTVRVFLGTQIGCAQCHDHPFDQWTQRQFYELAAYTAGTRTKLGGGDPEFKKGNTINRLIKEARDRTPDGKVSGSFQQLVRANQYAVRYNEAPLKLPHDYAYSDGKPHEVVKPNVLWGEIPGDAAKKTRREMFASWLTSRDNRQFAKTIANRLWKKVMGVGIVEPIDDFSDEHPPSNEALLEHLTDEMLRLNFDLREYVRLLVNTQTYQRRAVIYEASSGEPFYFPAPALRRMTAEQIWDSILTLVAYNPWGFQRPTAADIAPVVDLNLVNASLADADSATSRYDATYSRGAYSKKINALCGYKGQILVRASELPTPLPLGHFLRQFGQSDRETIEGSSTVATVPQILTMFNGPITHTMLERGSVIYDNVLAAGSANAQNVIFLSILSRRPSSIDRKLAVQEVLTAESPAAGYGNVIWSLLNTREFIFIQ